MDAIALVGGLNATVSDPSGIFLFRKEPPEVAVQLSEKATVDQPRNVVYLFDITEGSGMFLADQMKMRDDDILYVTDAPFATASGSIQTLAFLRRPSALPGPYHPFNRQLQGSDRLNR